MLVLVVLVAAGNACEVGRGTSGLGLKTVVREVLDDLLVPEIHRCGLSRYSYERKEIPSLSWIWLTTNALITDPVLLSAWSRGGVEFLERTRYNDIIVTGSKESI